MKAVLQYRASTGFLRRLRQHAPAWLTIENVDESDHAAVCHALQDADVLLHVLRPVTAEMLRGAPRLKLMQKIGVGTNTMDLEAAAAPSISSAARAMAGSSNPTSSTGSANSPAAPSASSATLRFRAASTALPLTVAGGISDEAQIAALTQLGCDCVLGMAIYTGKLDLARLRALR